jgi:hypothetical protein
MSIKPNAQVHQSRRALAERYGHIAATLQVLFQYIEVNITAVRKILKKFEKKVPAEYRVRHAQSYIAHHEFLMKDLQDMLVTVVSMHQLVVVDMKSSDVELDVRNISTSPMSFIGPETLQVLQRVRISTELNDLMNGQTTISISDVYAKPNTGGRNVAGRSAAGLELKSTVMGNPSHVTHTEATQSSAMIRKQVAANLGNAEMFQGPKIHPGQPIPSGAAAKGSSTGSAGRRDDEATGNSTAGQTGRGAAAGKGGGKRGGGRGNRGQRGSGGQPAQGGGAFTGARGRGGHTNAGGGPKHSGAYIDYTDGQGKGSPVARYPQNHQPMQAGNNANPNMQCMFMMVPAHWQSQSPATPPGSFEGSGNQVPSSVNLSGKGGRGAACGAVQMMGMDTMPSMDFNQQAQAWRGMMPQPYSMGLMRDGYPLGYSP